MILSVTSQDRNYHKPMSHVGRCSAQLKAPRSLPMGPSIPIEVLDQYQLVMDTPMFVQKIYKLVELDNDIIGWGPDGDKFIVHDANRLEKELLPLYFNHSNFSSFIRQLHFYRFSKTTQSSTQVEFRHPCFIRGRPNLLPLIVRKTNDGGSAQKRHIVELEEKIQELEHQNALLRNSISKLSAVQRLVVRDHRQATGFVSCGPTASQSLNQSMLPLSCLLMAMPSAIKPKIPFNGQKRFRPTIVQYN